MFENETRNPPILCLTFSPYQPREILSMHCTTYYDWEIYFALILPRPVIIFGAGASYDAFDIEHNTTPAETPRFEACRLPIIDHLFHPRYRAFPFAQNSALDVFMYEATKAVGRERIDLEGFLRNFQQTRISNEQRLEERWKHRKELLEFRYYLCKLLAGLHASLKSLRGNYQSDNYCHLLRALKNSRPEGAVLITFNYDLLLDEAVTKVLGHNCNTIERYFKDQSFPLFKVHGSINWAHNLTDSISVNDLPNQIRFLAENEAIEEKYRSATPQVIEIGNYPNFSSLLPAIHIPLPDEKGFLLREHEPLVTKALEETNKLILIGWGARDDCMVNLIKGKVRTFLTDVMVVSGSPTKNTSNAGLILKTITDQRNPWRFAAEKNNGFSGLTMLPALPFRTGGKERRADDDRHDAGDADEVAPVGQAAGGDDGGEFRPVASPAAGAVGGRGGDRPAAGGAGGGALGASGRCRPDLRGQPGSAAAADCDRLPIPLARRPRN